MRNISCSLYEKLCEVIPGGVSSPVRAFKEMGQTPLVVASANKDTLVDVDGRKYIDFCSSWGALIHGHCHPAVLEAINKRASLGTSFGATTEIEEKLARKISEKMPSIEKIRFVSSGTEATMSALRLARGVTGRSLFIKFTGNYHGHADAFLVQAGSGVADFCDSSSAGVPKEAILHTACLPFNDSAAITSFFKEKGKEIAAVIVEPVAGNMGVVPASLTFLETLRTLTQKYGSLLIFDEVITGFRVAMGGAQALYGIDPDLTCLGKIMGGGFPAAGFGGKQVFMDALAPLGKVYQAGTLSGNPVAMEAGLQALTLLEKPGFYEELESISAELEELCKKTIAKSGKKACIQRVGSMFTLFFGKEKVSNLEDAKALDHPRYANFFRQLFERGVYFPPSQYEACFFSSAHMRGTYEAIIEEELKKALSDNYKGV